MSNYTTLGEGKATKVLDVSAHQAARTVTTTDHETARQIARALNATSRKIDSALFPVAQHHDGQPVEARRRLLDRFDAVTGGVVPAPDPLWDAADTLIARVAAAVSEAPAPVVAAVRAELASHLDGFDGVLIPARVTSNGWKRMAADVTISGVLATYGDQFWDYLLGPHTQLWVEADDDLFPLGGELVTSIEWYEITMELTGAEPVGTGFTDFSVREVLDDCNDGEVPSLLVRVDHLRAWVAHHRPADLPALDSKLPQRS